VSSIFPSTSLAEALESIHPANVPGDCGTLNGIALGRADDAPHRARGIAAGDSGDDAANDGKVGTIPTTWAGLLVALVATMLVAPSGLAGFRAFRDSTDLSRFGVTSSAASMHSPASHMSQASRPAVLAAPAAPVEAPREDVGGTKIFDLAAELDKQPSEPQPTAVARPAIEATKGTLSFPTAANGHRIYIDGRVVGEPPAPIVVACGQHVVKVGSRGHARTMLIPCGESVDVSYP
jgi:hypothetical protein